MTEPNLKCPACGHKMLFEVTVSGLTQLGDVIVACPNCNHAPMEPIPRLRAVPDREAARVLGEEG